MAPNIEDPKMNEQNAESKKKEVLAKVETKVKDWSKKAAASTASGLKKLAPDDFHEEIAAIKDGVHVIKNKFVKGEAPLPEEGKPIPVDQLPKPSLKARILQTGGLFKKTVEETLAVKETVKIKPEAAPTVTTKTLILDKSDAPKLSKTPPPHADKKDPLPVYPPQKVVVTLEESSSDIAQKSAEAQARGLREYSEVPPLAGRTSAAVAKGRETLARSVRKTKEALQNLKQKAASLAAEEGKEQRKAIAADVKGTFVESAQGVAEGLKAVRHALEKRASFAKPVFRAVEKGAQSVSGKLKELKQSDGFAKVKEKVAKTTATAAEGVKKAAGTAGERLAEMKKKAASVKAAENEERASAGEEAKRPFNAEAAKEKIKDFGAKTSESIKSACAKAREKMSAGGEKGSAGEKLKSLSEKASQGLKAFGQSTKEKLASLKNKAAGSAESVSKEEKGPSLADKFKSFGGKISESAKGLAEKTREKAEKFMDTDDGAEEGGKPGFGEKFKGLGEKLSKGAKGLAENTKAKVEELRRSEKGQTAESAVKETVKDVMPSETIVDVSPEDIEQEAEQYAASETIDTKVLNAGGDPEESGSDADGAEEGFQKQNDSAGDNRNFRNNKKRRHH